MPRPKRYPDVVYVFRNGDGSLIAVDDIDEIDDDVHEVGVYHRDRVVQVVRTLSLVDVKTPNKS